MLPTSADLFLRACGLLLCMAVTAACALAKPGPGDRPAASTPVLTSYREMPVRLCVPMKAEDWTALRAGTTRLVLHLQNQVPSRFYSRTFHVSLVGPAEPQRVAIDELAMQPDNAPPGGGPPSPQNFAVDLRGHLPAAPVPSKLCLEVGIDPHGENDTAPGEEAAGHRLHIWATLEPLGAQGGKS
jgi:hypothetical protein